MIGEHYIEYCIYGYHAYCVNRYGTSSQVWIMLYRGSRDGYSAKQFHDKCDEKGPTLTLVKVISFVLVI